MIQKLTEVLSKVVTRVLTTVLILGSLSACEKEPEELSTLAEKEVVEKFPVSLDPIQEKELLEKLVATGTIAAKQTSAIGPLVEGIVEKIYVKVGDKVKKDQALFQTRNIDYIRRVDEIKAGMRVANAELKKAKRDSLRAAELVAKGLSATSKAEDADTNLNIALAKLAQIQTAFSGAQQALTDTVVHSPFDGAITARYVDEGTYMSNRFSGMGSSSVVQIQECEIAAAILFTPESNLSKLNLGLTGQLFIASNALPIDSEILIINDRVDPIARTAEFRMAFRNPGCKVKSGQFVRAEVNLPARQSLTLARTSIRKAQNKDYVFVVNKGLAEKRVVKIRDIDAIEVEIISGLSIGEKVIANPKAEIRVGSIVEIRKL